MDAGGEEEVQGKGAKTSGRTAEEDSLLDLISGSAGVAKVAKDTPAKQVQEQKMVTVKIDGVLQKVPVKKK